MDEEAPVHEPVVTKAKGKKTRAPRSENMQNSAANDRPSLGHEAEPANRLASDGHQGATAVDAPKSKAGRKQKRVYKPKATTTPTTEMTPTPSAAPAVSAESTGSPRGNGKTNAVKQTKKATRANRARHHTNNPSKPTSTDENAPPPAPSNGSHGGNVNSSHATTEVSDHAIADTPPAPNATKTAKPKKPKQQKKDQPSASPPLTDEVEASSNSPETAQPPPPSTAVSKKKKSNRSKNSKLHAEYVEHWHYDDVVAGLHDGSLFAGALRVNKQNPTEAYVSIPGVDRDLFLDGVSHQNRAVDGDIVALQLLPQAKWRSKTSSKPSGAPGHVSAPDPARHAEALDALWNPLVRAVPAAADAADGADTLGEHAKTLQAHIDAVQARLVGSRILPTATVVHILQRSDETYVGVVRAGKGAVLFDAFDKRLPRSIGIAARDMPDEYHRDPHAFAASMLCLVKLDDWGVDYRSPTGKFVQVVGPAASVDSDVLALLTTNSLLGHLQPFSDEIAAALPSAAEQQIPDDELARRRDLRDWTIFSIDPTTARDLDDAMSIRAVDEDTFEIGVHIADVSHFIPPGSALDLEAQARCTSVYFVNQVLPMLPRVLCEHLCSLNASVDRRAFSVLWRMHKDGSMVRDAPVWFGKTVIRSCCQMDYGTAQTILEAADDDTPFEWPRQPTGGHSKATIATCVRQLGAIARARRTARFATGAVQLHRPKLSFRLDEGGNPIEMTEYPIRESNHLVEEYMLLANYLVAQQLLQHGPPALLRNHAAPDPAKWANALSQLEKLDVHLDLNVHQFTAFMVQLEQDRGPVVLQTVRHLLTKPMSTAEYVVVDKYLTDYHRHFALNLPYYTHFTSPIRRYADVLVHRLLEASLTVGSTAAVDVSLEVVNQCNLQKARSKKAQQLCDLVFLARYIQRKGEVDTTGVVMGIGSGSFTLMLLSFGFEQRLNARDVAAKYKFDSVRQRMELTMASGATMSLEMFQPVQVKLTTTTKLPLELVYALVPPPS